MLSLKGKILVSRDPARVGQIVIFDLPDKDYWVLEYHTHRHDKESIACAKELIILRAISKNHCKTKPELIDIKSAIK